MKLIVGLGNPGKEYEQTRHNMGFWTLDKYASDHQLNFNKEKFGGIYTEILINNEKIILLKPMKYINLSGEVVKKYVDYFKISIEDIFIISDDLDLQVGKYKLKQKGGSGGHNGLKNIELHLSTNEYKRLKIGISNDKSIDTKDYVIGKMSKETKKQLEEVIEKVQPIIEEFSNLSFNNLMNKYN